MNITPFMLDQYANEYAELVRTRDAHALEMDTLRNANRALQTQMYVISGKSSCHLTLILLQSQTGGRPVEPQLRACESPGEQCNNDRSQALH